DFLMGFPDRLRKILYFSYAIIPNRISQTSSASIVKHADVLRRLSRMKSDGCKLVLRVAQIHDAKSRSIMCTLEAVRSLNESGNQKYVFVICGKVIDRHLEEEIVNHADRDKHIVFLPQLAA